jgi:hypothetical protein
MVFFPRWRSSMWTTILGTARSAFSTTTPQCLLHRCMPTQTMNTRIAAGFLNKQGGRTPRVRLCASPCHREPPGQTGGGEHDATNMTVRCFDLASLFLLVCCFEVPSPSSSWAPCFRYGAALRECVARAVAFGAGALVVSLGVDTLKVGLRVDLCHATTNHNQLIVNLFHMVCRATRWRCLAAASASSSATTCASGHA